MMYVPQHVETVEVPTVGALAEDGTFYMPSNWPGAPEQMLPQPQGHDGSAISLWVLVIVFYESIFEKKKI